MQLSLFTEYFQVPGLVFGPDLLPLKFKMTKQRRKMVKKKAETERKRKAAIPEKQRRRAERLQRRAERREEEKKSRAESGEPEVRKAKRSARKGNHGSEKVDATILKVLGRSQKRTAPKSKDKKVMKEKVAGPKWRHGMREARQEDRTGRRLKVKKVGEKTKTVEEKRPVEKQPAEKPFEQQPAEKEACVNVGHEEQPLEEEEEEPCVDMGADYEADGANFGHGDGAKALSWPLGPDCAAPSSGDGALPPSLQTPPPYMENYQVRRK